MKVLLFCFLAVAAVSSVPIFEDIEELDGGMEPQLFVPLGEVAGQGLRLKRATCDATSFTSKWLTINHSACAIHCLTKGYKGGKCKNTICHCRN